MWWGHPITTGIPSDSIDFFFSLDVEVDGPRTEPLSFEADAVAMDEADDFRFSRLDSESMDYRRHMQRLANLSYPTGPETERFSGSRSPSRRGDSAASHYTEQMVRMEYINSIFIEAVRIETSLYSYSTAFTPFLLDSITYFVVSGREFH